MDRRKFLAAGGLAAAAPLLAHAAADTCDTVAVASSGPVDFISDGLGLDPAQYAAALREATTARELHPDNYSNGGLIAELEATFARFLGKPAALYVPTGTLANHLAVRKLAGADRRVLVQAESHLYNDSGDGAAILSGLNLVPLAAGSSTITLDEIKHWVERSAGGRVETRIGVISIENPVRRRDHTMVDTDELQRIAAYARAQGIRLHLDGARMFNLPLHSGRSVREHAALFDTVYVSLWKHFNGASGAILAGDADFIDGLLHTRRMFGGALPQAWPQVAPVMKYVERYERDYADAWRAAEAWIALLQASGRFEVRRLPNGTSRFHLTAKDVAPQQLMQRLAQRGVIVPTPPGGSDTFALQVNPTILRASPAILAKHFIEASGA